MERSRLILIIAVGLLLSNLLLVGYIMAGRRHDHHDGPPPHGRPSGHGPRNIIIEKLHFSEAQVEEYDQLISWHRNEIDSTDQQIVELKNRLYHGLATPDSSGKDSLIAAISMAQQHIERVHYKHFEDIGKLCTAEQKPAFEALTREIASLFAPGPRKPPRP